VGTVYTLSFWMKADYNTSINLSGLAERHDLISSMNDNSITTEWKRLSVTFKAKQAISNICFYVGKGATSSTPYVYMCGLKIEKGSTATDWYEDAM
jgi:predicted transcriptional regulator YdeE